MARIFLWWLHILFSTIGFVFTIMPAVLDLADKRLLGLPWQIWVIAGFIIFAVSTWALVIRLGIELNKLTSKDAQRRREIEKKQESLLDYERLSRGIKDD